MDLSVQRSIEFYTHQNKDHHIVKLNWTHVQGTFSILLLGYIISTLIFAVEMFSQKKVEEVERMWIP